MSACTTANNITLRAHCKGLFSFFLSLLLLSGCAVNSTCFEPSIVYCPSGRTLEKTFSAFQELREEERVADWAKELFLGLEFAKEFDLYRAITCYKRALYLAPADKQFEIEYHIIEAYFLGLKYEELIEFYETHTLANTSLEFPALKELLLMLYQAYLETDRSEKALRIQCLLETIDQNLASKLTEYEIFTSADFCALERLAEDDESLICWMSSYKKEVKSIRKAQFLNAVFPGAGFYYVGQKKSGITSFVINALFTYAAYQFFDRGYIAAGLITTSLEMGWYLGGINGARLAANEWNERLYEVKAKDYMIQKRLFPVLMFSHAF